MSMYSYVQGLKPKTKEYEKKLQIYNLCTELDVLPPQEIVTFFDGEVCEEGILTDIPQDATREYTDDCCRYFLEVDLTKVPSDITKIRFVNSY